MSKYDNTVDNLQQLVEELKNYLKLYKQYTQLQLVEKLTLLLSALTPCAALVISKATIKKKEE